MSNMKRNSSGKRRVALVLCAGTALMLAQGVALGQQRERGPARGGQEREVLRGPEVDHVDVPGQRGRFGGSEMGNPRERGQAVPHAMFMQAVRTLGADDAPRGLALTEAQRESIQKIETAFRAERQKFMQENADELRAIRERGRPGERARDGERARPAERPQMDEQTMERARALRERAPRPESTHRAIFEVLNERQREHVQKTIETRRAEMQDRMQRTPAPEGRPMREGRPAPEGRPGQDARPGDRERMRRSGDGERPQRDAVQRWQRVTERIQQLPPERRERVLAAIEQMLDRAEQGTQRPEPPRMRDVDIPA